jgi:hypothetical protein
MHWTLNCFGNPLLTMEYSSIIIDNFIVPLIMLHKKNYIWKKLRFSLPWIELSKLHKIYSSSHIIDLSPNRTSCKCIFVEQLFDKKIKTYRNLLEINYNNIILLKRGQMHKMHKRKEILKNSCKWLKKKLL